MAGSPTGEVYYISEFGTPPSAMYWDFAYSFEEEHLPTLTEPGYKHVGWYYSPTFEEDTKIEPGSPSYQNGKLIDTLYAKWIENPEVYLVNGQILENIGNSIRLILNKNEKMTLSEMERALKAISSMEEKKF